MKTTNIEIYNFLNLTSHRFGRLYKYTGYSPLPNSFVITEKKIKEKLFLSKMKNDEIFPYFSCDEKRKIKKHFKICLKNCKKIIKSADFSAFSKEFAEKVEIYFDMNVELLQLILKEFKSHTFDEVQAFREVFNVDPVMSEFFESLFESGVELNSIFVDLEKKYKISFEKKLELLEINSKKSKQKKKEIENNLKIAEKCNENCKKISKKADKIAKNSQKLGNKEEIKKTKHDFKDLKSGKNKEK